MKEKAIEDGVLLRMRAEFGAWGQKVHSGSIVKSYRTKSGQIKQNKINLADRGTPDTIFCVPMEITPEMVGMKIGAFVAIEIKKNEEEVEKWLRKVERYEKTGSCPASNIREIAQSEQMNRINRCGGIAFVCADIDELDFLSNLNLTTLFKEGNAKELTKAIKKAKNNDIFK